MSECEHEPSFWVKHGPHLVESIICPCPKCGELVAYPVAALQAERSERLRLVADAPIAPHP